MFRFRFAALALSGFTLAASSVSAQQKIPGWTYTMNMTVDSGGPARTTSIAIRYAVTDKRLRQEFVQVSGSPLGEGAEGMYMLFSAGDSTMTSVMPRQRMASVIAFPPTGFDMQKMRFTSHVRTSVEDLGAGERIMGHATHHVRTTMSGSIDRTMPSGEVCKTPANGVTDMWIAPDIDLGPAMSMMLRQLGGSMNVDSIMTANAQSGVPKGLPIRMVTRSGVAGVNGEARTVISTIEYRDIARTMFDASYFEAPAGFHVMDMRKMMSEMPAGVMDSVMRAQAEKTSGTLCGMGTL